MLPGSIKPVVLPHETRFKFFFVSEQQPHLYMERHRAKSIGCYMSVRNIMRMSLNSLVIVPDSFFLERDLQAKMLVVSSRLLDIGIIEIYLETFSDFGKY